MFETKDNRKMDLIIRLLLRQEIRQIRILTDLRKLRKHMAEIDDALAAILVRVQETDGKTDSLIVLFNGLKDQLLNIGKLTDGQKAAVAAIMDEATAQAAEIDAAVEAKPV